MELRSYPYFPPIGIKVCQRRTQLWCWWIKTGQIASVLDGTYLTQLRTGAAQGLATELLARKDSKVGVLFGTGGQAATQLEAMLTVRRLKQVYIFARNKKRPAEFAARMQTALSSYNAELIANADLSWALSVADVITAVTTANEPVFDGRLVKKGTHVNGVGSYTPKMQELDEYILTRADKVFVDSKKAVMAEAGDFIKPLAAGVIDPNQIGELGELALGKIPGRRSDEEITLFKTVGIAVQDLVTAGAIYKKAVEEGVGTKIEL